MTQRQWAHDQSRTTIGSANTYLAEQNRHGEHPSQKKRGGRRQPLRLLDLPLDILQSILKEVTHTNDLSALALTHSALHDLVIPLIYSRFDIVWPDANPTVESRMGVDALTYGLATLVMAHDVFGEASFRRQKAGDQVSDCQVGANHSGEGRTRPRKIRRGNYYAQYTRKFSLGNGPEDWVREYLITKEGGKMLGTLVALAVGRMRNLESFTWDMPTGVLRDVWLALASLADRDDGQACKLERVWVRWHDNLDHVPTPPPAASHTLTAQPTDLPSILTGTGIPSFHIPPYPRVEFPTFSVLPALKSLNVLDVDELSYVEEMSVLIERSLHQLSELRVGVARHAQHDTWARPREDRQLVSPSLMYPNEPTLRPGGLLGILVSRFCPAFSVSSVSGQSVTGVTAMSSFHVESGFETGTTKNLSFTRAEERAGPAGTVDVVQLTTMMSAQSIHGADQQEFGDSADQLFNVSGIPKSTLAVPSKETEQFVGSNTENQQRCFELEVLELERIYLSIPVLSRAFNWTKLTSLTLLGCRNHDQLWKALRRKFTPTSRRRTLSISGTSTTLSDGRQTNGPSSSITSTTEYKLNITKIHTDTVSNALLALIRDALAPESLQWLFLQQTESYKSMVTIEQIYKCVIRPHRGSLKKLLIDSDLRMEDGPPTTNWRRWSFSRELITCITSGRMKLRELSMSIDYKDWHYFLQRLPNAAGLRSLHIAHIADYVHGRVDSRDTAQQILDVVALRPELELCYVAIQSKCFEVLEITDDRTVSAASRLSPLIPMTRPAVDDGDTSDEHEDHDDGDDAQDDDSEPGHDTDHDDDYDMSDEDVTTEENQRTIFKLREILFYDDKISIFRARHGKL